MPILDRDGAESILEKKLLYRQLASETVHCMRGERSQGWINRRFEVRYNKVGKWETNRLAIRWDDFVDFCGFCQIDLPAILKDLFNHTAKPKKCGDLIQNVLQGRDVERLLASTRISTSSLNRWRRNEVVPALHSMLELLDCCGGRHFAFISSLTKPNTIPSFQSKVPIEILEQNLVCAHPFLAGIPYALEIREYLDLSQHDTKVVADGLNLSVEKAQQGLDMLESIGAIRNVNGKFVHHCRGHVDFRANKKAFENLLSYWLTQSRNSVPVSNHRALTRHGCLFFPVTKQTWAKICELARGFMGSVIDLTNSDKEPGDFVGSVVLSLLDNRAPNK